MLHSCAYFVKCCVMVSRSHGILNGFWSGTVSGILNVFVNLVTCGITLLYVFISVYFPVGSIYFFRMLVKFLHNRPAKFTFEKSMKAQRGSRLYYFFDIGAKWGGWSTSRPGCYTPLKNPAPFVQEDRWVPGPVWTGGGKSRLHRDSISGPSSP